MLALIARTGVLVLLGVAAGLVLNSLRADGVALNGGPPAAACQLAAVAQPVQRLSPAQANHLCANPNVLVADARSPESFAQGHVAGAVHLPCAAPGGVAQGIPSLLAGRSTVVVYGDTTDEALAVADGLVRRNSNQALRVAVLEGGFGAWQLAGFACASGPCPECAEAGNNPNGDNHKNGKGELVWPGPSGAHP